MKQLLILLFSLLAVSGFAANPAYTDFRGTNEVLVATNPTTGRIIIGPATPISTQINAAQVWTNNPALQAGFATPANRVAIISTNGVQIQDPNSILPNTLLLPGEYSTLGVDWYSYLRAPGDIAIFMSWDSDGAGYGRTLGIDPDNDNSLGTAFLFSSTYSNVIAASSPLFTIQNAHTNKFVVAGDGGISNSTFQTTSTKTTNATALDVAGLLSAYNGIATLLHNTSTNTLITVGSSPFNFTNTASQTIVLYLDANGATTTANLNGQTIFKSLAAGDHTIILKPGAYTTIAYAIATPIMTWTEL